MLTRKEQLSELQLQLEKKNTGMHDLHCRFSFFIVQGNEKPMHFFFCAGQVKSSQALSGTNQVGCPETEVNNIRAEIKSLKGQLDALLSNPTKIQAADIAANLETLGKKGKSVITYLFLTISLVLTKLFDDWVSFLISMSTATKAEVLDMIWEVDENLDQCVDWEETHLMFLRNANDVTGLEPSKFYNMIHFMMYDISNSGTVSVDEAMNMLYSR